MRYRFTETTEAHLSGIGHSADLGRKTPKTFERGVIVTEFKRWPGWVAFQVEGDPGEGIEGSAVYQLPVEKFETVTEELAPVS